VGLERGQLSLVSATEELLGRKSGGSVLENREYVSRDPSRSPRGTLYLQRLALTSPTSGGRWVGIARSLTQATEFSYGPTKSSNYRLCLGHTVTAVNTTAGLLTVAPSGAT
jgi:hypothetical protein